MQYSTAIVLALAAGVLGGDSYGSASNGTNVAYTTVWTTDFTTVCPAATEITMGSKTYTVTEATTLTITDCPCTQVIPVKTYATPIITMEYTSCSTTPSHTTLLPVYSSFINPLISTPAAIVPVVATTPAVVPVAATTPVVIPVAATTPVVVIPAKSSASAVAVSPVESAPAVIVPVAISKSSIAPIVIASKTMATYIPIATGSYSKTTSSAGVEFTGAANANSGFSLAGLAGVAALAFAL